MKGIRYIGKKPQRSDNVADTGLVWLPRQVHIVTDAVAAMLLKHPDIWDEVPLDLSPPAAEKIEVTDSKPKKPKAPEEPTPYERVNTRDMSLNELRQYAGSHLPGFKLPGKITEDTARRLVNNELKVRKGRQG